MSEQIDTTVDMNEMLKMDILRNTPCDQDPLIYWHQVAQDAIKSADKERERTKYALAGRDKAEREFNGLTERLVQQNAANRNDMPLDLSRIIQMASSGTIDLSISLYISGGTGGNNSGE